MEDQVSKVREYDAASSFSPPLTNMADSDSKSKVRNSSVRLTAVFVQLKNITVAVAVLINKKNSHYPETEVK